jgi:hypothetical protein
MLDGLGGPSRKPPSHPTRWRGSSAMRCGMHHAPYRIPPVVATSHPATVIRRHGHYSTPSSSRCSNQVVSLLQRDLESTSSTNTCAGFVRYKFTLSAVALRGSGLAVALIDDMLPKGDATAVMAAGLGAGMVAPLLLPVLTGVARPVAEVALQTGLTLYREAIVPASVAATRLIIEAREELRPRARDTVAEAVPTASGRSGEDENRETPKEAPRRKQPARRQGPSQFVAARTGRKTQPKRKR